MAENTGSLSPLSLPLTLQLRFKQGRLGLASAKQKPSPTQAATACWPGFVSDVAL